MFKITHASHTESASETRIYLRSPPDSVSGVRGAALLLGGEELADLPSKAQREGCCQPQMSYRV